MAWIFGLSVECGIDKTTAEAVAEHFNGFAIHIEETVHLCSTGVSCERGAWWASVVPDNVSQSGVRDVRDRKQMTLVGFVLYEHLRSAPIFRYAIAGVEPLDFRSFEELDEDIVRLNFDGLVLAEWLWSQLGSPGVFVPFAKGYRWRPFVLD